MVVRYSGVAPPLLYHRSVRNESVNNLNGATFLQMCWKFHTIVEFCSLALPFSWLFAMRPLTNTAKKKNLYIYIYAPVCPQIRFASARQGQNHSEVFCNFFFIFLNVNADTDKTAATKVNNYQ